MSIRIQLNKLHSKELQDMCALPNFTTVIKDDGENAARFEEK
jgi:hypothetical protein